MANNEILQIVVFSMFFGVACAALGETAQGFVQLIEELSHVILRITGYVMKLAPIAVFAAMAAIVTTQGLGILLTYGKFVGEFYFGLVAPLVSSGRWSASLSLAPRSCGFCIWSASRSCSPSPPQAARPRIRRLLEQLEEFGVQQKIISFVLPLGYSFNLDGSMMYCTFATLFIAQAYNIDLLARRSRSPCC